HELGLAFRTAGEEERLTGDCGEPERQGALLHLEPAQRAAGRTGQVQVLEPDGDAVVDDALEQGELLPRRLVVRRLAVVDDRPASAGDLRQAGFVRLAVDPLAVPPDLAVAGDRHKKPCSVVSHGASLRPPGPSTPDPPGGLPRVRSGSPARTTAALALTLEHGRG